MSQLIRKDRQSRAIDIAKLAEQYGHEPGFVWLDSSLQMENRGTKSYLARRPVCEVRYRAGVSEIERFDRLDRHDSDMPRYLQYVEQLCERDSLVAIGYISYEACFPFADLPESRSEQPLARFYCYESIIEHDHITGRSSYSNPDCESFDTAPSPKTTAATRQTVRRLKATIEREQYLASVRRIKEHIREGDIYQANFTTRFDLSSGEDPLAVYSRLRSLNPAPYAAYLNFGDCQILSSSPEKMLRRSGRRISTSPIKGTISSGSTPSEREAKQNRLINSAKDRAELLMIVDLERNDLGKVAKVGSVNVDSLCHAEEYRSLFHLVSDISAEVDPSVSTARVLAALLPGGSITGAPKRRAIQILEQLESTPRGVYTGCIGMIRPGYADFNIAIRTIIHQNQTYHIHAGGGIVADSLPEAEYDEMLLKASNLLRAVGVTEEEMACLKL